MTRAERQGWALYWALLSRAGYSKEEIGAAFGVHPTTVLYALSSRRREKVLRVGARRFARNGAAKCET